MYTWPLDLIVLFVIIFSVVISIVFFSVVVSIVFFSVVILTEVDLRVEVVQVGILSTV